MTTNTDPLEEQESGDELGATLRVLFVQAYNQGFNDRTDNTKFNSSHNKDEYVAAAYKIIRATHNSEIEKAEVRGMTKEAVLTHRKDK